MNFTKGFKTENNKLALSPQERALADLCLAGWKEQDAYVLIYGMNPAYSDEWHKAKIKQITNDENYAKYIQRSQKKAERKAAREEQKAATTETTADIRMLDKDSVLRELLYTINSLPVDDPKRADVLMKYADLTQMKKEEVVKEDKTVHFYLPISCKNCELYLARQRSDRRKHTSS